jgi:heme/copper-type cytochrome/quinol oxidase subunit 3
MSLASKSRDVSGQRVTRKWTVSIWKVRFFLSLEYVLFNSLFYFYFYFIPDLFEISNQPPNAVGTV